MKTIKILTLFLGLLVSVLVNAADSSGTDPLEGMANLLEQEHQHTRSSSPPMSLAELESVALSGNPALRLMYRRIAIAEAKARNIFTREFSSNVSSSYRVAPVGSRYAGSVSLRHLPEVA